MHTTLLDHLHRPHHGQVALQVLQSQMGHMKPDSLETHKSAKEVIVLDELDTVQIKTSETIVRENQSKSHV